MQYQLKITVRSRSRYPGLFGFERGMGAHHSALMAAMRHYESIGDDASLGLVLVALVRGRKPWMMDLRYKYFKLNRLVRFSEVLLVLLRWVMRNLSMPLDDIRRLLKKLEHHLPHRDKRVAVTEYLYRALEEAGRAADAYDTARLLGRHDMMGFMRKKQMNLAIGRGAIDMYRPIDPAVWGRTPRGSRSLLTDAEVRFLLSSFSRRSLVVLSLSLRPVMWVLTTTSTADSPLPSTTPPTTTTTASSTTGAQG